MWRDASNPERGGAVPRPFRIVPKRPRPSDSEMVPHAAKRLASNHGSVRLLSQPASGHQSPTTGIAALTLGKRKRSASLSADPPDAVQCLEPPDFSLGDVGALMISGDDSAVSSTGGPSPETQPRMSAAATCAALSAQRLPFLRSHVHAAFHNSADVVGTFVRRCVHDSRVRSVLLLGVGNGDLLPFLKGQETLGTLTGVDDDEDALRAASRRIATFADEVSTRETDLRLLLIKGSVLQPDARLTDYNMAVAHRVLDSVTDATQLSAFTQALLGYHRPGIVLLTTANADFDPDASARHLAESDRPLGIDAVTGRTGGSDNNGCSGSGSGSSSPCRGKGACPSPCLLHRDCPAAAAAAAAALGTGLASGLHGMPTRQGSDDVIMGTASPPLPHPAPSVGWTRVDFARWVLPTASYYGYRASLYTVDFHADVPPEIGGETLIAVLELQSRSGKRPAVATVTGDACVVAEATIGRKPVFS